MGGGPRIDLAIDSKEYDMTDVPAQRTEPDTSELKVRAPAEAPFCGRLGRSSESKYGSLYCTLGEGHDGPHSASGATRDGAGMVEVYDEWTDPAPADWPLTEAIAVERLALDDPDEQALLDAYKEAKDAADKAECVVAEANDDAERACRYADDCAEALLRAKTAFAQARLKLIGVL